MTDRLIVWLGHDIAGALVRSRDSERFWFEAAEDAPAITMADAGRERIWAPVFSRRWFEGLLPEGAPRQAAEQHHHIDPGDTFALLEAIGWECAGAISVMPEGRVPDTGWYSPMTEAEAISRLDAAPGIVGDLDLSIRLSLGGAQDKLLWRRLDDVWALPLDGAPSTHILKPEPNRWPGLALAEAWSLAVAAEATTTSEVAVFAPAGHRATIIVTRYDRVEVDGAIRRQHQEDLCQLSGLSSNAKYASVGSKPRPDDPALSHLAELLVRRAADPPTELVRLLEQTVVNMALGNADAHAKNHSVLHEDGTATLSPLYDVSPTMAFLPEQHTAALRIDGKARMDGITRGHLVREAVGWGIPSALAQATVEEVLERLRSGMAVADSSYPELPAGIRALAERHFDRLATSDPG
jgi:serine/threonine-protein kinase HipA